MTDVQSQLDSLKREISSWTHANRGGAFNRANNLRGSQVSHSQLIGAFHPVLSDFGGVSTYELQSPSKAQLGLTIVPDGKVANGSNVFGIINQVVGGVYTAGFASAGFDGLPAPNILFALQSGNPDTIFSIWNFSPSQYVFQLGSGSNSPTSGTGLLQIGGNTQKLWGAKRTPASSAATGYLGEVCFDDNFFYVYTSAGWKRSALSAF